MEPWFDWHKRFGTLPDEIAGLEVGELYDRLGLSMRYVDYYTGQPSPLETEYESPIRVEHLEDAPDRSRTVYHTPLGELVTENHLTIDETWRIVGFPVSSLDDLLRLECVFEHRWSVLNTEKLEQGRAYIGERGEPQFYLPKSPYQELCQHWMKLDDFLYALIDHREVVERVMRKIDASYDRLYRQVAECGLVKIVNFGENIHAHLLSPSYWQEYLVPWYEKRCAQLRSGGVFSHVHIDGYYRPLLPYLNDIPHDGIEALTPLPQGDVSIEETAEWVRDKIVLDGIPAVYFLPTYSMDQLQECTERLVQSFGNRLVMGISDELPEGASPECLERVEWVSSYCRRTVPPGSPSDPVLTA